MLRRIARKVLRRGRGTDRLSLVLEHTATHAKLRGAVAEGALVEGLEARLMGAVPAKTIKFSQKPAKSFAFDLDLAELHEEMGRQQGSYDLYLRVKVPGTKDAERLRLGTFRETDRDRAVEPVPVNDTQAFLHITGMGNVSLHFADEVIRRTKVTTISLKSRPQALTFDLLVESYSRPIDSIEGSWVARQSSQRFEFPLTISEQVDARRTGFGLYSYRVSGKLVPSVFTDDHDSTDDIYDPYLDIVTNGLDDVTKGPIKRGPWYRTSMRDVVVPVGGERQLLVPYFTFRAQRLAFWSERFATRDLAYMRRLRWVSWLFFLVRPFTGIWLVGEAPYKAQDNGFHFFRWLRQHHPKRRAYYVIEKDSPDRSRVEPFGNVLLRHSRKHILYSSLASRFVGSHHAEYLHASRSASVARSSKGLRVFLQHGVTAAKNVTFNYGRRKMFEAPADVFCVNSELERDIVIQDLEFLPSQVPITGFARFDTLLADDVEVEKRILVMPTWRDSLNNRDNFLVSDFLARWKGFLEHPELRRVADAHGMTVELVLHPNMRHYATLFDIPGVIVRAPGDDVQGLIKSSSVLITDYSSVAWDFSFLERPVLYYQFDRAGFIGGRQPFIDFTTQLPGDIAFDEVELIAMLEKRAGSGMPDEYRERARAFLTHRDQNNCQRIYDVVHHADGFKARATRVRNTRWVRNAYMTFRSSTNYHRIMVWLFRLAKALPSQNSIVFESDRGQSYGGSPRAMYESLIQRDHGLKINVVNNGPLRLPDPSTRKIDRLSPRYYWQMGRAKYWVFNQNAADQFAPSRRIHFMQTWHGTPLKKMQNDVAVMYGRDNDYHHRAQMLVDRWSSLLSPSVYATAAFTSAFGFRKEILETGYPCNDIFSAPDVAERAKLVKQRLGISSDDQRKIVLYAPTFRDDMRKGKHWVAELAIDLDKLGAELGNEVILLVRFHPLVRHKFASELSDLVRDVSRFPDTQDLLIASDVLITDYSSVMFDFAQTGRQSLFFTYDIETYRDKLRGFYFDFENEAPGPLVSTSDELIAALKDLPKVTEEYAERRAEFRQKFGPLEDGRAADRALDALLGTDG